LQGDTRYGSSNLAGVNTAKNEGKKGGAILGLISSIFGAIIAGIAVIDREEIFD